MTISIDQRKAAKGRKKFFFRYYTKGRKPWSETFDIFTIDKPQTKADREANKTAWELIKSIQSKRLLDYQTGKYGFTSNHKGKASFLDYFKALTEKRKSNSGNYGNWDSVYKILVRFTQPQGLTFEEVTPDFLERFRKHLLENKITKSNTTLERNSALSYFNKVKAALNQAFDDRIIQDKVAIRVKGIKGRIYFLEIPLQIR